jgi:hypothetical protein
MSDYDFLTLESLQYLYETTGNYPKYFGLGFFQLKVTEFRRFHYYHADLKPILHEEEIHDHRYPFHSMVHRGTLNNRIWYYEPVMESDYELVHVTCKEGQDDVPVIVNSNVRKIMLCNFPVVAGSSYDLTEDVFHQVYHDGHVVTELTRPAPFKEFSRIIRDKRTPYVCPFSAPVTIDQTWDYLKDVLA